MHPAHKAVVARSLYSRCESEDADDTGTELTGVEILDVYDEPVQIPGESGEVASKAVTVKITATTPLLKDPLTVTRTVHAVPVDGEWHLDSQGWRL